MPLTLAYPPQLESIYIAHTKNALCSCQSTNQPSSYALVVKSYIYIEAQPTGPFACQTPPINRQLTIQMQSFAQPNMIPERKRALYVYACVYMCFHVNKKKKHEKQEEKGSLLSQCTAQLTNRNKRRLLLNFGCEQRLEIKV
jgi:hypothetical protein